MNCQPVFSRLFLGNRLSRSAYFMGQTTVSGGLTIKRVCSLAGLFSILDLIVWINGGCIFRFYMATQTVAQRKSDPVVATATEFPGGDLGHRHHLVGLFRVHGKDGRMAVDTGQPQCVNKVGEDDIGLKLTFGEDDNI